MREYVADSDGTADHLQCRLATFIYVHAEGLTLHFHPNLAVLVYQILKECGIELL
jgi:hypothetical protein